MQRYIYDEISGKHLRDESYAVVYNTHTGHYGFVSPVWIPIV